MKNNKTTISIAVICFTALLLSPLFAFKGEKPKTETKVVTETKCFVNQNSGTIKMYIELYAKQGFTVKQLISQSVSISINGYYNSISSTGHYRELRGDIILVLEKQTTVTVTTK